MEYHPFIRKMGLSFVIAIWIAGCNPAPSSTAASNTPVGADNQQAATTKLTTTQHGKPQRITILALGDSLTEGLGVAETDNYPAQLEVALKKTGAQVKVVNSGLSGETSTGLVNRLEWALKTKPDITILTIGANDAMRGIDIAIIEQNIRQAIERIQKTGSVVVLGGMQIYENMGEDYVQAFAAMYQRIAQDTGVAFIPFFLDGVAADNTLNQSDRIHPNAAGYSYIVEHNILPVLAPVLNNVIAKQQAQANQKQ